VRECCVIGVPDAKRGHIVEAHVVLMPDVKGDADMVRSLQDHVKQTIAPYKYPRSVKFVAELPKTATGKMQRFRLKEQQR
jgi:2-aminobenzoate-CoA ligase